MQQEVTILFPLHNNQGVSLSSKVQQLVREVCTISGGVATWEQNGIEIWDDGAVYCDRALRAVTIVDSALKVRLLRNIALRAIEELEQRGGIFFQVHDTCVEFLSREDTHKTEPLLQAV